MSNQNNGEQEFPKVAYKQQVCVGTHTMTTYDEAAEFDINELLAIRPVLKGGKIIRVSVTPRRG